MNQSPIPVLVLFGCPGAGKGSLARFLAADYGFVPLSTGAAMRAWAAGESPEQREARARLAKGEYLSDELAARVVAESIERLPSGTPGVILDGYPRNPAQFAAWRAGGGEGQAFVLQVEEAVALERIADRGTCPRDGTGFPGVGNPCPICGTPTVRREDDTEAATLRARFAAYREKVLPVLEAWAESGLPINYLNGEVDLAGLHRVATDVVAIATAPKRMNYERA